MKNKTINARLLALPLTAVAAAIISINAAAQQGEAMETITVTAQVANASSDIERQRKSNKVVAVQTSDAIGELPDANVTEALQRMPGVFIARDQGEGRFVGVRGIDPNLNASTINGMSLPAPETDSRAVALDVIPSDLLASLEVFKTLTPDMSADSIGGAIEIKSLNALDHEGQAYKISVENSYSDLQEENSPKVAGTFTNVFELDGGRELGVAIAASHQERKFGSENVETDGAWEMLEAEDGRETLYFGEEDRGVWRLDLAAFNAGEGRPELVAEVDGERLVDDVEGMGLYLDGEQGYLVVSSQGNNSYALYNRDGSGFVGRFRVDMNPTTGVDGASETDGLDVTSAALGADYPRGLLVVQDGRKRMPSGTQNFKLVSWADIEGRLKLQ